ncbi:hypothetical protein WJX74_009959 [Apatococcus lobatus]|uniref:Uncharacterized protein n=1 Tax=Apatococcus lobatus TaxID=904363 RepID=A0AAW1Q8N4_9CHLO
MFSSSLGSGYLECETQLSLSATSSSCLPAPEAAHGQDLQEHDVAAAPTEDAPCHSATLCWHICYSPSYRVPVLYFAAHLPDGSRLQHQHLAAQLPMLGEMSQPDSDGTSSPPDHLLSAAPLQHKLCPDSHPFLHHST